MTDTYYEPRKTWAQARSRSPPPAARHAQVRFSDYLDEDNSQNVLKWMGAQGPDPKQAGRNRHAAVPAQSSGKERDDSLRGEAGVGVDKVPYKQRLDREEACPEGPLQHRNDPRHASWDPAIHVYRASEAGDNDMVTIHHLEWDLEADLDDEVEEYSRLARLGQFRTAQEYFDRQLAQHAGHPLIFAKHAETLWEMGEFKSVVSLAGRAAQVFPSPSGWPKRRQTRTPRGRRGSDSNVLGDLYLNWKLVYWISLSLSQKDCEIVYREITEAWIEFPMVQDPASTTSTRLQNLYLFDCLKNILPQLSSTVPWPLSTETIYWLDWRQTYQLLKSQGRVWDFRTIYLTRVWHMVEYHGGMSSLLDTGQIPLLDVFFDVQGPADFCQRIRDDWLAVSSTDVSIHLALIDIFSQTTLKTVNHCTVPELATVALRHADSLSEHLLLRRPELANTSPLLHWLFARACVAHRLSRKSDDDDDDDDDDGPQPATMANMTGAYFEPMWPGTYTPYYIPVLSENPGWTQPAMPAHLGQTLQMLSRAAQSQRNWRLQAACLSERIFGSASPSALLHELAEIQHAKQGELYMYTISCLSRYLLVATTTTTTTTSSEEAARTALRDDLAQLGSWDKAHLLASSLAAVVAARDVVLSALTPSDIRAHGSAIKPALQYYAILPPWFQAKIAEVLPALFKTTTTPTTMSLAGYWNQYASNYWGYPTPYYYYYPPQNAGQGRRRRHASALSGVRGKGLTDDPTSRLRELGLKRREIELKRFLDAEARVRGEARGSRGGSVGSNELSDIEQEISELRKRFGGESGSDWETEDEISPDDEDSPETFEGEASSTPEDLTPDVYMVDEID